MKSEQRQTGIRVQGSEASDHGLAFDPRTPTLDPRPLTPDLTPISYADLIGQPYTKEHDCNWLVAEIFRRAGQFYPHVQTPEDPDQWSETFQQAFLKYGRPTTDIAPCTIMTFCFSEPRRLAPEPSKLEWHMGVMVTRFKMLTTTQKMGVHIINRTPQSPLEGLWWAHFRGAWRVKPEYQQPESSNQQPTTKPCST